MSQAKFEGPASAPKLEHRPGAALSLCRDLPGEGPARRWRHWIVRVEPIGRITVPADARRALDVDASLQAITRDWTLILRRGGLGARLPIDQRGRLVPPWLRRAADLSGSVLVSARIADSPTVVVAPSSVLDDLVDDAAGEVQ